MNVIAFTFFYILLSKLKAYLISKFSLVGYYN